MGITTPSLRNGDLTFSGLAIRHSMSLADLLTTASSKQVERWSSQAGYDTYRVNSVKADEQSFILLVVFHQGRINRVTISVDGPESSWEKFTPETAARDGLILRKLLRAEFGSEQDKQVFDWGKVELWQDIRNGLDYQITVTYQHS